MCDGGVRVMETEIYNYRSGEQVIPKSISNEIIEVIQSMNYSLGRYEIKGFKDDLAVKLKEIGWTGPVPLSSQSNITISAILKNIGLCTQTGNMARFYADLIKLQTMYMDDKIKAAIYVIPKKECAKEFGDNVANYDRFVKELTNFYSKVITIPMIVIGFDNKEE